MLLTTFVIPSKGRATLANTLLSIALQKQNMYNSFNCVVVFDDVAPTIQNISPLFRAIRTPKKLGIGVNGAGDVRNYGIDCMEKVNSLGRWISFVDDDDTIDLDYCNKLYQYDNDDADIIIFRMQYQDGTILPPTNETNINNLENKVGISYSIRSNIYLSGLRFNPSSGEDFNLLDTANKAGLRIIIVPDIMYYVSPLGCAPDRC